MLGFSLVVAVAIGLIGLLVYVLGSKDPYSTMTEEEFEEATRKKSLLGAAIMGLEGSLRRRETTILMEAKSRVETDATPSPGDPPEENESHARHPSAKSGIR
jgi:hypothetical protein